MTQQPVKRDVSALIELREWIDSHDREIAFEPATCAKAHKMV